MGKSIDLPDPLESASSTPLGNADDLLAQLAGEEVDRLLAEADAEERPADAATPAPPAAEAPIQDQLDALFSEIATPNAAAPLEPAPGQPAPAAAPATEMAVRPIVAEDALAATPPAAPDADIAATALAAATPATSRSSAELETTSAERHALAEPEPADEMPATGELMALAAPAEDDAPLPMYLKPLEWMNAPFAFLPQGARDALGQIAIFTLVNAVAVLIYVFVFRKS